METAGRLGVYGAGCTCGPADARICLPLGPLAQLVEQLTLNQQVQGSSPWRLTFPELLHVSTRHTDRAPLFLYVADEVLSHLRIGDAAILAQRCLRLRDSTLHRVERLEAQSSCGIGIAGSCE